MGDDDAFLTRWSKRKLDGDAPAPPDEGARGEGEKHAGLRTADDPSRSAPGDGAAEASPVEHIDVDALTFEDDFTVFLKEGVPAKVRRMALRKLWASNPLFATVDGLNDYDDDFTDAALAVKVLKTAHVVGKGYVNEASGAEQEADDTHSPEDGEEEGVGEAAPPHEDTVARGDGHDDAPRSGEAPDAPGEAEELG